MTDNQQVIARREQIWRGGAGEDEPIRRLMAAAPYIVAGVVALVFLKSPAQASSDLGGAIHFFAGVTIGGVFSPLCALSVRLARGPVNVNGRSDSQCGDHGGRPGGVL